MKQLVLAVGAMLLVACQRGPAPGELGSGALVGAPQGPLVALVNGEAVTEPLLLSFARANNLDPAVPDQRQKALDGLIDALVLAQEAAAKGLLNKPEVQAEAALVRMQHVAGHALADQRNRMQADDAQVAALYEQEKQRAGDTEWRSLHILFADEAVAKDALQRALTEGADFGSLMNEYRNGLAKQATEIPWSNATQLPEELVEALRQLEDGQVAPAVISTSYGYHVLRRLEARPFAAPSFESVKEGARRQLIEGALRDYVAGLRTRADITVGAATPGG